MERFYSLDSASHRPTVVALGCFDGVHLGHAAVIGETRRQAQACNVACAVWTFAEPPRNFFAPRSVPLLTDQESKGCLIEELGADLFFCVPFDETVCNMTAESFFEEILRKRMQACHLVCGYNYTFGAKGTGNVSLLRTLCDSHGVGLTVLPPVTVDSVTVSSSLIREKIEQGDPSTAATWLGRPYFLSAPVVDGQHLARKLGFPTVNQLFPSFLTVPRAGVYATRVTLPDSSEPLYGISNVGIRPTVKSNILCCETHIFDYVGDLYQKTVKVEFLSFLRPEQKFSSLEAMSEQVRRDMQAVRNFLSNEVIR